MSATRRGATPTAFPGSRKARATSAYRERYRCEDMRFNLSGSSVALSRLPLVLALLLAAVSMLFVPGNETHAQAAVPAAPTGLAAPTVAHDSVTLSWDDPGDGSITGYQVLRRSRDGDEYGDGEGATGFVVIVDDTGSQATIYTDTSVTARTRYVYRLKAINSVGLSPRSSYLNVETSAAPPPPSAPAAPTGLTTSSVAHDSVTLSWDDPGDSSITGYQVLRRSRDGSEYGDGEGATGFVVIVDDTGSQATIYTDTSVIARTRYVYRVKAINSVGLSPRSSYLNIETSAAPPSPSVPAAPTGLIASSVAHDSVTLSWNDPGDSTIESYQVLRRSRDRSEYGDGLGDTELVAIVDDTGSSATTYTDTSVAARTRYAYGVKARNSQGLSEVSDSANGETQAAPPPLTSKPTGLTVSSASHDSVTLTWNDPGDSTIESYQVLRRSRDGAEYGDGLGAAEFVVIVDDTGSSATTYTDKSVTARTRYAYGVKARNSQGLSEVSDSANAETSEAPASEPVQPCQNGYVPPTPTDVAVTAVPIVVESTTADYFVLYVSHDLDGATVWYPVQVTLGKDGTTELAENVAAPPRERYRVEKYLIVNPADVDGDCIDDISELNDLGAMNPVNPAGTVAPTHGALVVPDWETLETIAYAYTDGALLVKFSIVDINTDRPRVYFQDTSEFPEHGDYLDFIDIEWDYWTTVRATIMYNPELAAPDGTPGVYLLKIKIPVPRGDRLSYFERTYTLLAASMPLLDDNLALWIQNSELPAVQADLPLFRASRMGMVFDEDVYGETDFLVLNPGEGYGLLRSLEPDERPSSRDVVIYETLPNELPRVAGIISAVPQTPLSHVNLRALQDSVPNAFIADALQDEIISGLIGSYVHYAVTETGYSIRAATQSEVDAHHASSRPAEAQTPQRDLSVTSITPLSNIEFDDWDSFGVKAANVAVLGTLGFPDGTIPDGFAVPFYFYDEFMKQNGLYEDIEEMLADSDFQTDYETKADELKKLRKKIKKAETPEWIETALTAMHATFPEGTSLRYRSSTNNEDLPGFNGAGLYDSKTQHAEETEEDGVSKSLKQVYASLWNFRAFIERDFHRIDHLAAAMGVLVHPNYSDELVNGVAASVDPAYGTEGTHYVNSQVGEDLVTNPEAHSVPEEILLYPDGTRRVVALSNQVPQGQLLMNGDQLAQLHRHLAAIHERFAGLYGVEDGERFAMEIEFKITSDNILAIKQARPWIFASTPPAIDNAPAEDPGVALTASFEDVPATHDGNFFRVRIRFSEFVNYRSFDALQAVTVTGGRVERAFRVDRRSDLWNLRIYPDSPLLNVTLVLADNRPCAVLGAICTLNGRRLSNRLEHTVESLRPRVPDRPTGRAPASDIVVLEWNDVPRARSYDIQFMHIDQWIDLPANGIGIDFDGTGAVVRSLPPSDVYYFRVRAVNSNGASEWSDHLAIPIRLDLESELTAGRSTHILPVRSGYAALGDRVGALSPDSFEIDGTTYRVQFLLHASQGLWLGVQPELPADFTLIVGDSAYLGSESMVPKVRTAAGGYWWPSASPDWLGDDPVEVGLIVHPGVALGDRQKAPVTGHFQNFPTEHDWIEDFTFRIYFSEGVATTADALRDHVLSVTGGTVSGVEAVGDESRIWALSVTPESSEPITVRIEAGLDCALPGAICSADGRRLFNRMELMVEAREYNPPTGAPIIRGTVEAGQILTADTSGIADADGLTGATFSYQWVSYNGNGYRDIQGATDSTYTLVPADEGQSFKVRVSFTDDAGYKESLTSALFGSEWPYGLNASESDGAVVLTWKLPAGWPYGSTFQILRNRPELGETAPLVHVRFTDTGTAAYTDTDVESGVLYVYRVKGVDPFGFPQEASEPVEIRTTESTAIENTPATGDPTISGTVQVGETLSADTSEIADEDGLNNAAFSYQWLADDADIQDATDSTYVLDPDDEGKTIKVRVSFTDDAGNEETLTSAPTAQVARSSNHPATGLPVIRGQVRVGATLRASLSILDDPDGLSGATFTYQWLADDAEIRDATDSTYVLDTNDEGKTIKVRVSFTDAAGNEETLTSVATSVVAPR